MKLSNLPLRVSLSLILSVIITAFCGLIFFTLGQNYRLSANDPQIQISEYTANMLSQGGDVKTIMPPEQADLSRSLATFVIAYDKDGNPTASSAKLDGQVPVLPKGVLDAALINGQNRVTWQPKEGVRIAAVVTRFEGGYVLAGRSLREVDARIKILAKHAISAWVVIIGITFLGTWLLIPKEKPH